VLLEFQEKMGLPALGWPCRVLGEESYLRGDALVLKQYLLSQTPEAKEGHFLYRSVIEDRVLIAVSVSAQGTDFRIVGAPPPEGAFWHGDFEDGPPENTRHVLRRSRVGDRFLTKLAARTDGLGFESETTSSYEPSDDPEALILKTEVRDFTPNPGTTVRRSKVKQNGSGSCFEFGPVGEELDIPALSRRSPMAVGQYYTSLYCFSDLCCEEHVTVEAFEEVTVPAGTFQAFRLRLQSPLPERLGWFAPELNAMVKETVRCAGYVSMEVLHEFTLEGRVTKN
jgi:hypothetical protein